jgi:hypothetical protein
LPFPREPEKSLKNEDELTNRNFFAGQERDSPIQRIIRNFQGDTARVGSKSYRKKGG